MQTAMHVKPDRVGIKHTFDTLIGESIRTLRKRFQPTHPADWKARVRNGFNITIPFSRNPDFAGHSPKCSLAAVVCAGRP